RPGPRQARPRPTRCPRRKSAAAKAPIPPATATGKRTAAASTSDVRRRRTTQRTSADGDPRTSPVTAPAGVPVADHHDHVDPAPCLRHRADRRRVRAGLVAAGAGRRRRGLRGRRRLPGLAAGQAVPVRLLAGAGVPPAQRHPAPGLGRRLRLRDPGVLRLRLDRRGADRGVHPGDLVLRPGSRRMSNIGTAGDPRRSDRNGTRLDELRTPLKRARGLGSGKSGTGHWWWQRVTAVALVRLAAGLVGRLGSLGGADVAQARETIAGPWNAVAVAALVIAMFWDAKLGIQVVIEDYVHARGLEVALQMLVSIACALGALACLYALGHVAMTAVTTAS